MRATVVELKIVPRAARSAVLAYCSITLNDLLVIHDLRYINGRRKRFVAMPNRRAFTKCTCGNKCDVQSNYCSNCGKELPPPSLDPDQRQYLDIVHPVNQIGRDLFEDAVGQAWNTYRDGAKEAKYYEQSLIMIVGANEEVTKKQLDLLCYQGVIVQEDLHDPKHGKIRDLVRDYQLDGWAFGDSGRVIIIP